MCSESVNSEVRAAERGTGFRGQIRQDLEQTWTITADVWRLRLRLQFVLSARMALLIVALLVTGCQQKMADQPRYEPLEASRFFADGQSARPLVEGVVARGWIEDDPRFLLGLSSEQAFAADWDAPSLDRGEEYADTFPIRITLAAVQRGQKHFGINCAPCHGRLGSGTGPVVEGGFPRAASFHTERLRQAPPGYLFDVITRGYQKMPSYAEQLAPEERWEVITYVRALQLSQYAELDRLPADIRERFQQ